MVSSAAATSKDDELMRLRAQLRQSNESATEQAGQRDQQLLALNAKHHSDTLAMRDEIYRLHSLLAAQQQQQAQPQPINVPMMPQPAQPISVPMMPQPVYGVLPTQIAPAVQQPYLPPQPAQPYPPPQLQSTNHNQSFRADEHTALLKLQLQYLHQIIYQQQQQQQLRLLPTAPQPPVLSMTSPSSLYGAGPMQARVVPIADGVPAVPPMPMAQGYAANGAVGGGVGQQWPSQEAYYYARQAHRLKRKVLELKGEKRDLQERLRQSQGGQGGGL